MTYKAIEGVKVIGITGRAGHGKDEIARIISNLIPDVRRYTFSDAIATVARVNRQMGARDPKVLQDVGMQWRHLDPTLWVDCVYWSIVDHKPAVAVLAGVRFPEEAQMIKDIGGRIIKVTRTNSDGTLYVKGDRDESHPAEGGLEAVKWDELIENDGDLNNLIRIVYRRVGAWLI